jgi:hypothetical protein
VPILASIFGIVPTLLSAVVFFSFLDNLSELDFESLGNRLRLAVERFGHSSNNGTDPKKKRKKRGLDGQTDRVNLALSWFKSLFKKSA